MKCDIIIPIWNQPELTRSCIEHITKNTRYPHRLILVDNGSDGETKKYLKDLKDKKGSAIELIRNEKNLGFVKAVNQGLRASQAPYVCILNNDTMPGVGWLTELVKFAEENPRVGLVNPMCNGHIQHNMSVNEYARLIATSNKGRFMEMNQCQAFAMLIKRSLIDKIGYLDEKFGMGGFDDTDYSKRAGVAGYRSVCVHSSYVYHREHASFDKMGDRKKIQSASEKGYFKKWPRHKRVAIIFSVSKDTGDEKIERFLDFTLSHARSWCWVNLLVFGGSFAQERIDAVKQKMNFPLHQNIKLNYLNAALKIPEISVRILERSFGRKKRKRYDTIICPETRLIPLLKVLSRAQKSRVILKNFKPFPKCDIILPVCDEYEFTKKCIESMLEKTDTPYRLIVINNGKNPATRKFLEELGKDKTVETMIVHNGYNIGWVKALNRGMELSDAPYVCFQNDDTIVTEGWLRKMINILERDDKFGVINPTWEGRHPSVSIDRYNRLLQKNRKKFIETDWCRGFSVVVKRAVMDRIGKVDEIYGLAYFDDVDYSVTAIEAGFLAVRALDTYVYHKRNATFFEVLKGKKWNELHEKNKLIYYKKWGRPLKIVVVLNKRVFENEKTLCNVENAVFYLARKQHHVDIWSPRKLKGRFRHTNIKSKVYPPGLLQMFLSFDLNVNAKRKPEKRYSAVFKDTEKYDFPERMKETVDRMKEETKEAVHADM